MFPSWQTVLADVAEHGSYHSRFVGELHEADIAPSGSRNENHVAHPMLDVFEGVRDLAHFKVFLPHRIKIKFRDLRVK